MDLEFLLFSDSICDSAPGEIVGCQLYSDSVSGENFDEVFSYLAWYMGKNFMAIVEFYSKRGIGQGLPDGSFKFDYALLGH